MNCSFILYLHSATLYYLSDTCTALDFIQCRSAQTNTEKCSAVQCTTVRYTQFSSEHLNRAQNSTARCLPVQCSEVQCCTEQCRYVNVSRRIE